MARVAGESFQEVGRVRPDAKGRITLGKLARGVSSFAVHRDRQGRLLLEPYAEVPARERWLFENPDALGRLVRGIEDGTAGRIRGLGSFQRHARSKDSE